MEGEAPSEQPCAPASRMHGLRFILDVEGHLGVSTM